MQPPIQIIHFEKEDDRLKFLWSAPILFAVVLLFAACSPFQSNQNFTCNQTSNNNNNQISGSLDCSYTGFNDTRERQLGIRVKEEQVIVVDYTANITSGNITFEFRDEQGNLIYEQTFTNGESGQFELTMKPSGYVRAKMTGRNVSGSTNFSWSSQ